MDQITYNSASRASYRAKPCPSCGKAREVGWSDAGSGVDSDQWLPDEKCRNRECPEYRDPNSLAG